MNPTTQTISGTDISLRRPNDRNTGWVVFVGHRRIGTLDWTADHSWFIDLTPNTRRHFDRDVRRITLGHHTRDDALRGLLVTLGIGIEIDAEKCMDRDFDLWNDCENAAIDLGLDGDDALTWAVREFRTRTTAHLRAFQFQGR